MDRKDVRTGDTVVIRRAGDVIPEVVKVVKEKRTGREKPFTMPPKCPVCNSKVERTGAIHFCTAGLSCPAQLKESISHFVSKRAMDIDGLGWKHIEQFVSEGLVNDVSDLYSLDKDRIMGLDRWAEKSVDNLIEAISGSRKPTLKRLIYSLGIRGVGERLSGLLAEEFGSIDNIKKTGADELGDVREVGPETSRNIVEFFAEPINARVLERLEKAGVEFPAGAKKEKGKLSGKRFLFTGTMESMSREEAARGVEALGGTASSGVSKKLDYVVAGREPGGKLEKAGKLELKIIDEEEFKKLLGQEGGRTKKDKKGKTG